MKGRSAILLSLSGLLSVAGAVFAETPSGGAASLAVVVPSTRQFQVAASRGAQEPCLSPPVPTYPPPAIPPHLRSIVGATKAGVAERLAAVHGLGRNLTPEEIATLSAFLKALPGPQEENLPALRLLKNDIVNVLRDQTAPPKGFTDTLIEVYRNSVQDNVIRDYAIQHLVAWAGQGLADAPDAQLKVRAVLREATHGSSSIAGTALLGLHRLSASGAASADQVISSQALALARTPDTSPATRITALQVCAERGVSEALPTIESLVRAQDNIALRLSAIAALGRLGGAEHLALLRSMQTEGCEALQPAIHAALEQLTEKLKQFATNSNPT